LSGTSGGAQANGTGAARFALLYADPPRHFETYTPAGGGRRKRHWGRECSKSTGFIGRPFWRRGNGLLPDSGDLFPVLGLWLTLEQNSKSLGNKISHLALSPEPKCPPIVV
jgi:hypothetical protein